MDKFFRDKNGKVVLFQRPNAPLIIWFIAAVAAILFRSHEAGLYFRIIALAAIAIWACLEIATGTTYFRRTLGALVLFGIIAVRLLKFH